MTFGDRLDKLIMTLGLNRPKFAEKVGSTKQTLGHIINNKSSPNYALVEGILNAFPEVNAEWLTRGIEPMMKNDNQGESQLVSENNLNKTDPGVDQGWENLTLKEIGELINGMKNKSK